MAPQEEAPPHTHAHCSLHQFHQASEGKKHSSCRCRGHRRESCCNERRNSDEAKRRQRSCNQHPQDQPKSHHHRHPMTRRDSDDASVHVPSENPNAACNCHCDPVRAPQTTRKECLCHPRSKHTTHKSGVLEGRDVDTCHSGVQQPLRHEMHGARWVLGPPLPAIVLGQSSYGPGFARG